ncbi:tetratricopeptide repeat protein [Phreatobacter sp.]|uniref:tetratricopeptide repeat protein n=1 Tax=Phreatobacter sp. TaxID=1966341 RepID=UPI003F724411
MSVATAAPAVLARRAVLIGLAVASLALGGCQTSARRGGDVTGSISNVRYTEQQARTEINTLATRYQSNPQDAANAMRYGRALRATGQAGQAVAVLERVAVRNQTNMALLGEYGRALADIGRHEQALEVLGRAHRPDQPDWRIVNVQGSIFDQMGRPDEARRHYEHALRISPGQPTVLANLGLSHALSRQLPQAEQVLRQAAAHPEADQRIRQNLALVVGLQGRFGEAEEIARKDLPPAEAEQNVAYLRQMLSQQNSWAQIRQNERRRPGAPQQAGGSAPAAPAPPRG